MAEEVGWRTDGETNDWKLGWTWEGISMSRDFELGWEKRVGQASDMYIASKVGSVSWEWGISFCPFLLN